MGNKYSKGKPKLSILIRQFPRALKAICSVSEYGHNKYIESDEDYLNFIRVPDAENQYRDAGLRHELERGINELDESGYPHIYHKAWNALAELEIYERNRIRTDAK